MDEKEIKQLFQNNNISYLYYGPEEKKLDSVNLNYDFLKLVFSKGDIDIYKVIW